MGRVLYAPMPPRPTRTGLSPVKSARVTNRRAPRRVFERGHLMRRIGGILLMTGSLAAVGFATLSGQGGQAGANRATTAKPYTTWRSYAGGQHSSQYSALEQINKGNVGKLAVAWSYPI